MIRRLVARGLLSVVLAAALFSLFRLPAGAATVYQEITGMEELTSGQYVLVTPPGDAPGILLGEDFVISTTKPTFTGDTVAARCGMEPDGDGERGHSDGRSRRVRRTPGRRQKRHRRRDV